MKKVTRDRSQIKKLGHVQGACVRHMQGCIVYILYIVIKDHYIPNASVSGEDSQVRNIQSENLTPNCGLRDAQRSQKMYKILA